MKVAFGSGSGFRFTPIRGVNLEPTFTGSGSRVQGEPSKMLNTLTHRVSAFWVAK